MNKNMASGARKVFPLTYVPVLDKAEKFRNTLAYFLERE